MAVLIALGAGLKQREQKVAVLLQQSVNLKRTLKERTEVLNGLELSDLQRRVELYAEDLIDPTSDVQTRLFDLIEADVATVRWSIDEIEVDEISEPSATSPLGSVGAVLTGSMPLELVEVNRLDREQRLPGLSAVRLARLLWSAPPYKEFDYLLIERGDEAYQLKLGLFLPTWTIQTPEKATPSDG
jgi:hypothetical protein